MSRNAANAKAECEELLWDYRQAKRQAFLTPNARFEQGLEPLPEDVLVIAQRLLAAPDQESASLALREMGVQRCAEVLHAVLPNWRPTFAGSSVVSIYPFLELSAPDLHVLIDRIDLGITGVRIHSAIWTTLQEEHPVAFQNTPANLPPPHRESWWAGFARITDDLGTSYSPPSRVTNMPHPMLVTVGGHTENRWGQNYRDAFRPGFPPGARYLYLTPSRQVRIDRPFAAERHQSSHGPLSVTQSWSRVVSFDKVTFVLDVRPPQP